MQLLAIRNEIRLRYGVAPNDPFYDDANLNTLINAALRQINLVQDWPWMQVNASVDTTLDDNIVTMPTDARRVVKISYQNIEIRQFNERTKPDWFEREGAPRVYAYEGGNWVVYPRPDAVYAMDVTYVQKSEATLVNDTDEPLLPDWCIDSLLSKVCVMMARRARDLDLERNFYGEYMQIMESMMDEQVKSTEGMSPRRTRVEERMGYSGGWY